MNAFHLHFFLIGEGPADGDLVRTVIRVAGNCLEIELGYRAQGCWVRQVDARDFDDGLPRGFLAGAIVEVWLALHLNWA